MCPQKDFERIYGKKQADIHLYIVTSLIYFVGHVFISKFILENEELVGSHQGSSKNFKNLENTLNSQFKNLNLFELEYFIPLISLSEKENLSFFYNLIHKAQSLIPIPEIINAL